MKCNVGKTDKYVRIILGLILIGVGVILKVLKIGGLESLLIPVILGAVLLFTAATKFCLLYVPFKINTGKDSGA